MILNGMDTIKRLLPSVNLCNDSDSLDDFIARAQEWVTSKIIGSDLEGTLNASPSEPDAHARLRLLVQRVIADKAYLMFADEMNVQLSEAGLVVQNNEQMSAASSARRDNLINSLNNRLDLDCNALVNYLLHKSLPEGQTAALYPDWRTTEHFTYLTEAFLPTLEILVLHIPFTKRYSNHWTDFYNNILNISLAIENIAGSYVSTAEIRRLRNLYRANNLNSVQEQVVSFLQSVGAACLVNDDFQARQMAIRARTVMLEHTSDFTEFANSNCANLSGVSFNEGNIVDTL